MTGTGDNAQKIRKTEMLEASNRLRQAFEGSLPASNRRDFLKVSAGMTSALLAGGVIRNAGAAPSAGSRNSVSRFQDIETGVEVTVPLDPYGQSMVLDPHRAPNWGPFWVMFPNIWGGLLRYDENGKVEMDLADKMELSDDNKTYTFTLKDGLKYASGNDVVAGDFITSWKRALQPGQLSPMASFMADITGYSDFTTGASEDLGVEAPDDKTVVIHLRKGFNYYPSLLASYVYSVIDPAVLADKGDEDFVLGSAGTGPWMPTSFDPAAQMIMEPNTNYYDGNSPSISKVTWLFLTGPDAASAALDLYQQDKVISADVPLSLISQVKGDDTMSKELQSIAAPGSVRAIMMDFLEEPFNDVRVRRAVAQSVDTDKWANDIWQGTWAPAGGFSPPVLKEIAGYTPPDGLGFDADAAKEQLKDAGFENGEGLPTITWYRPSEDPQVELDNAQALVDMIKENSGIDINLDVSHSATEIQQIQATDGGRQFDVVWWWNLYETPHLLNEVFSNDSPYMKGIFNWDTDLEPIGGYDPGADSKTFEGLADDIDYSFDQDERNGIATQAETLVINNAVAAPLGYWLQNYVQKANVQGTRQGAWTGRLPVLFDKDVVIAKS